MKSTLRIFTILAIMLSATVSLTVAQTIHLEIDPYQTQANELDNRPDCELANNNYANNCGPNNRGPENTDCDDCTFGGSEDMDIGIAFNVDGYNSPTSFTNDENCGVQTNSFDFFGGSYCSGSCPDLAVDRNVAYGSTIYVRLGGAEDDSGFCSSDLSGSNDGQCSYGGNTYGNYYNNLPTNPAYGTTSHYIPNQCPWGWSGYYWSGIENCHSESSTNDYRANWRYRYHFVSGMSAGSINNSDVTTCSGTYDPPNLCRSGGTSCAQSYYWEYRYNGGSWSSAGSTASCFNPGTIGQGVHEYRLRVGFVTNFSGGQSYVYSNIRKYIVNGYPDRNSVTVSDACWATDDNNTYTITAVATDIGAGIDRMLILINYQDGNGNPDGGYFAWDDDSYTWTGGGADNIAPSGNAGGYSSKNPSGYGYQYITLVGSTANWSGNQLTVTFTVRPNGSFPESIWNDISFYASSNDGYCHSGWGNWDLNFNSWQNPFATASVDNSTICLGSGINTATFTLSNPSPGSFVRWQYRWNDVGGWNNWGTSNPYSWNPGGNAGQTLFVRAETSYDGCTEYSNVVPVLVDYVPAPTASISETSICAGGTVDLTATDLAPGGGTSGVGVFNGSAYSTLGDAAELNITGSMTIEMWVKPTNFGARRNPYAKAYGGEGTITIETSGTLSYYYGTNGGNGAPYQGFSSGVPITAGAWNHIAIVRDLSAMELRWYINGLLVSTVGANYSSATAGSNPAYIGAGYVSNFLGNMDNVRIWNDARTGIEIAQDMYYEFPTSAGNLVANYVFNGNLNDSQGGPATNGANTGVTYAGQDYYTYTWSGTGAPGASVNETQTTSTLNSAGTYNYTVVATPPQNCPSPSSNQVSVTVTNDPTEPSLNSASPSSGTTVCVGATVSATFNAGSNGLSCTDQYQYTVNGGISWNTYTPGNNITATSTGTNEIQIQTRRNCTGPFCDGSGESWTTKAQWTVVADPTAPSITKSPTDATVCAGQTLTVSPSGGSGGTGTCNNQYRYSTNNGSTWSSWSTSVPSFAAVTGTNLIESQRDCNGSGCNSNVNQVSWSVVAGPSAPSITKSPNVAAVCEGQNLTVTPSGGSGGTGTCNNEYRYSTNNGSTWSSWSTSVPSFAAVTGTNLVESRRECTGSGCNSNVNQVSWTVTADPVAPTITKSPNVSTVCEGQTLTVSPSGGSGGTGTCNNQYRYSTNNGSTWSSWSTSLPSFAAVTGTNLVESRRDCDGNGCNTNVNQVSWSVVADPAAPTMTKSPNVATVCEGQTLTVTPSGGSGGTGTCDNEYRFSTNNGSTWSSWSTSVPSFAAVTGTNLVESRRDCNGSGCNSNVNQVGWSVVADPSAPSMTKSPNTATVCEGQTLTVTPSGGSGGTGTCNNEYRYSTNNGSTWSSWSTSVPSFAAVTGTNLVESRRECSGSGCNSNVNQVGWSVVADPTAPTLTKSPNDAVVCAGTTLTVTPSGGTGGTGTCNNEYRYSTNNGVTWSSWSTSVPSFAAAIGVNLVESRRDCSGSGCNSNVNQVSWTGVAVGVAPVIAKSPNEATVCVGATLSVTVTVPGAGGTGTCNDEYRYSTNNGSTWSSWSTTIPSFAAVIGTNLVEARRNCDGVGCGSNVNQVSWAVIADPVAPTITKNPNVASVCEGATLTVTNTGGSGGTGTCDNEYRYSTNNGSTWTAWSGTIPNFTAVTGTNLVESRRICSGSGCESNYNQVSWSVVADQVLPTLNTATPASGSSICLNTDVSATFNAGSGGISCADSYEYTVNAGVNWFAYTPGTPITATNFGTNVVQIRAYRNCTGSGCDNDGPVTVAFWTVYTPTAVSLTLGTDEVCVDVTSVPLTGGTPAGGSWSGPGVIGSDFFPGSVGAGTYTITYSYVDGNGCTNSATDDITVHDLPTVSLNLVTNEACEDATSVALSGGNPAGGTWSGTGVSGSTFNPNAAGSGSHTITYTYTDGNGCTASATDVFTVNPLPTVSLTLADDVACLSDVPFNLSGASPAGGTWSGTGITNGANGTFDPSVAGVGNHTITYTYTDGNGCTDAATDVMEVRGAPTVNFTLAQDAICVNASAIALSGGSGAPAGGSGSYSGPGVSLGNFDPAVAGVGVHTITYTYTDNAGCSAQATDDMTVQSISSAPTSLNAPTAVCSGSPVTLTATGGTPGHGAVYEWATNPGFTGSTTTAGNTYNVVVNSTTTWYVRLTGTCNTTAAASATVSVSQPSALVHLVDDGDVYGFDGAVLTEICEDGNGFTYYSIVGQYDKYIFAINWDPLNTGGGHNSAAKASAVPYITVDATYTAAISTPASACEATWSMRRYWNVTSDPLDGPVLVRFYYDMAESNAIITAKNNHIITYGCNDEGEDWFKVPGTFDPSADMSPVNPIGAQYLFNSNSGSLTDNSVLYAELLVNGFSGGTQATGTGPLGNPLPVELVSFTATALDRSIMLDWTTLSEVNNEKFEILKSIDGLSFIAIDEVPGNGTTSDPHDYSYEDRDVQPGVVYYYRLRQVDYDGTSELSSIVSAVISGNLEFAIGEFVPNPTTNFTAIDITVPADEVIGITIYDVLGKEVYRANQLLKKGQNTIDLDVAEFKQGAYIATFASGFAGVYSKKFTVVK